MGCCCVKKAKSGSVAQQIDIFSEASNSMYIKQFIKEEDSHETIVEAHCQDCKKIMTKSNVRPNTKVNWKCDGCGDSYNVRPGFDFYSCKKCKADWCPNCFHHVETKTVVKNTKNNIFNYDDLL